MFPLVLASGSGVVSCGSLVPRFGAGQASSVSWPAVSVSPSVASPVSSVSSSSSASASAVSGGTGTVRDLPLSDVVELGQGLAVALLLLMVTVGFLVGSQMGSR